MNKRQLELQNQLYTLFEEDRHPAFITNLIEKIELGIIYADLTENERNEVFSEFKEMYDLNEGFFKDMKEKNKTNRERIFKGIFVKEIHTEDGSIKYKKVDKEDAEYIIKGRKLYTLEGEFIKNISPVVYRETFPKLSGKEAEIRIKDKKEDLREEEIFESYQKNKREFNKLSKKGENEGLTDEEKKRKKELRLKMIDHQFRLGNYVDPELDKLDNPIGFIKIDTSKTEKRLYKKGLEDKITKLKRDQWSLKDQPDPGLEKEIYNSEKKLANIKENQTLTESVTYVDNAGRIKTSSTEGYVKSMHEYDTKYQIPTIPSVVSKKLKKKNLKEDNNLEAGE